MAKKIDIYRDGIWAGTGVISWAGRIEDCAAELGSDAEASEETYDLIEDAIENGDDYLDRPDGRYTWAINETKCDECGEVMRSTGPACQPCPDCHRKRNMSDMTSFLIYRIGANAANQSCRDRMAVAIVDAPTEALALEHA